MTIKIQKPILVVGVSISFLLWFWQRIQASFSQIEEFSLWALIALGIVFWWWKPKAKISPPEVKVYTPISKAILEKTVNECQTLLNQLAIEKGITEDFKAELEGIKTSIVWENSEIVNKEVKCAITGRKKAGKSTLKKILESHSSLSKCNFNFRETDIFVNNLEVENQEVKINQCCLESHLLLFVVNGDLTDSELQVIKKIAAYNQRLLLVFNQKDRYLEDEQLVLLKQLQDSVKLVINPEDIISIATSPTEIKVKKHQKDGVIQEWKEKPQPDIKILVNHLQNVAENEKLALFLSTNYSQLITLKSKIKNRLNEVRKQKSLPIIEKYQFMAAAAAFANPVSSLDLLATVAINAQMLVDLSNIYQQKLSLEKAKTISFTMGKLMVKLGIVEFSTQTLGSILKSNFVTYIAGGAVQGVSAAYLTRIAGLSLVEYFQVQEISIKQSFNQDKFQHKIQAIFQENKKEIFLQNFVKTTAGKLILDNG